MTGGGSGQLPRRAGLNTVLTEEEKFSQMGKGSRGRLGQRGLREQSEEEHGACRRQCKAEA